MLSEKLRPIQTDDLFRLGSKHDGGYVCSVQSIKASKYLISLGVGDNWDFEKDFIKMAPVDSKQILVDYSVGWKSWIKSIARKWINHEYGFATKCRSILGPILFRKFILTSNIFFLKKMVGSTGENGISMDQIFEYCIGEKCYIKIDIEGYEYRILNSLVPFLPNISGISIEFHDYDIHQDRVLSWLAEINRFGFEVIWINANNYAGVDAFNTPHVIEMTLVKREFISNEGGVGSGTTQLTTPNNPKKPPIHLSYESTNGSE